MVSSQMITANYFDGQNARLHPVELKPGDDALMVHGRRVAKEYAFADVTLAEPFAQAPRVLYFADGARCEVDDAGAGQRWRDALGYRASAVVRWQQRWPAALAALVLLLATGFAIVTWGAAGRRRKNCGDHPAGARPAPRRERAAARWTRN